MLMIGPHGYQWCIACSHPPSSQSTLSTRGVALDPIDSLSGQASFLRDLSNTRRLLPEHGAHLDELIACVARFAADVGVVVILLGVFDASALSGLGRFSPVTEP
jgi:hypothetical protein